MRPRFLSSLLVKYDNSLDAYMPNTTRLRLILDELDLHLLSPVVLRRILRRAEVSRKFHTCLGDSCRYPDKSFFSSTVKLQWSLRVSLLILPPQIPRSIPGMSGGYSQHHRPGSSTPATSPLALSSASSSSSSLPLSSPGHSKSKSLAFFGTSQPNTPVPVETGTHHLLPLPSIHPHQQYTSYRAVPDLSFIPTLFQSPEAQAATEKLGLAIEDRDVDISSAGQGETVVLMPTKIETVEVNIPLRVYPSATPFRPHVSTFSV